MFTTLRARGAAALVVGAGALVGAVAAADVNTPVDTGGLKSHSGYYLAARHANRERDLKAAADYYRSALLGDSANPDLLEQTVTLLIAAGEIEQAVARSDELLEFDPDNRRALTAVAMEAFGRGEHEKARQALARLAEGGPFPKLLSGLLDAWILADQGAFQEAIDELKSLDGPNWYSPIVPFHTALIADLGGQQETAIETLRPAFEPAGAEFRLTSALARALARNDERDEALKVLRQYAEAVGSEANIADLAKAIESGEEIAPYVADARAGAAEALFNLGAAIADDNNIVESAGYMRLALHLEPTSPFAALALGTTLMTLDQHEEAIGVFERIPETATTYPEAVIQTVLSLDKLGRVDEAIAKLHERIEAAPEDIEAGITLGNLLRSHDRFAEAAEAYTALIGRLGEVPEPFWSLYYYRGISYEQTKRWSEAEADFRKALELEPEQPLVLNYLGYSLIDRGEKLEEAVSMVEKAVEQRPQDGYIVDSLGWAYYRLGNFENAVKELERAVSLRPEDPVINDHLGDGYWKVGRKLEATFQWRHARDLDPKPEDLKRIRAKLREGLDAVEAEEPTAAAAIEEPSTE